MYVDMSMCRYSIGRYRSTLLGSADIEMKHSFHDVSICVYRYVTDMPIWYRYVDMSTVRVLDMKLSSTLQLIEVYCLSTLYSTEVCNSSSLPVFIAFSEFQHGARDENKPFTITGSEVENIAPATIGDTCCEPRRQHLDTETQPRMCTCIFPYTYDVCVLRILRWIIGSSMCRYVSVVLWICRCVDAWCICVDMSICWWRVP